MPDPYQQLPQDDESPAALLDDAEEYYATVVPGWAPSDASPEVALMATSAEEGATLYSLLREDADDRFRDFGQTILGVPSVEALPATTTATFVARQNAPVGGYTLDGGTTIAVDAEAGRFGFEVIETQVIAEGDDTAAGVAIQALDAGTAANGATGTVLLDEPPAWLLSVTIDAPAAGGTDGDDDAANLEAIVRAAQLLSRVPILPRDFELVAQEVTGVDRAFVRNLYNDDTGLDNQERTVSVYPVNSEGLAVDSDTKTAVEALILERREVNWVAVVADPDYSTIDVDITVIINEGADSATVADLVETQIRTDALSPARWGQPLTGDQITSQIRSIVRRYHVASSVDLVQGVDEVTEVLLAIHPASVADADVTMPGSVPIPIAGTVNVTVELPS